MMDGTVWLYRAGKNGEALEKREAESDVVRAFVHHMTYDAPKGSSKIVEMSGKKYKLLVTLEESEPKA